MAVVLGGAVTGGGAARGSIVNFETAPVLSQGPSIYVAVPGPQTIETTPATCTGGVVLGFATFFPAISFATAPNVYGTADFGNHLPEQLSIAIDPTFTATEVSFALFNGEVFNQSYLAQAFNGSTVVASQTLSNVSPNFNSGYGLIDLLAPAGITSVAITPVGTPSAWDFLIDTVAFNASLATVVPPPPVDVLPPTPPVQGHRHGHGEAEPLEVDFGDDVNDIRGSVLVVQAVPEAGTLGVVMMGVVGLVARRRRVR